MIPPPGNDSAPTLNAVEHTRWFTEEVHPHERSLRSYLQGTFPQVGDIDDVVQESYLRTLRARASQPIRSARAFLFTVARRLALDTLRHEKASPIDGVAQLETLRVIDDVADVAENVGRRERISIMGDAIAALPVRCRAVFVLHKIKGLSRRETAAQLGLAERTVEIQTANAIRRCARYLQRRGVEELFEHAAK
jgi:RNA polymerase sigma-70 factor (ECF subfamily)